MKKTQLKKQDQESPSLIRTLLLIVLISFAFSAAQAQSSYVSAIVIRDITGSGLGGNICPSLGLTVDRHTVFAGVNIQRQNMNVSGMQANYRYSAAKTPTGKFELYFSANITYHHSAMMSRSYQEIEQSCNKEKQLDFSDYRLKVTESYAGFGMMAHPTKRFTVAAGLGMGMFHTCTPDYNREMYREKSAVALRFNFSLIYHFKKTVHAKFNN